MTTTTSKRGVPVRGTCKAGHTTETTSTPGRVTWEGECSTDGCSHPVRARRVPSTERTATPPADAPADTPPAAPPAAPDDPHAVKEVSYDAPQPKRRQPPAPRERDGRDAGGKPAGEPPVSDPERPTGDGRPPAGGSPVVAPGKPERPRRRLPRFRFASPLD
jgi:hypothetical protein